MQEDKFGKKGKTNAALTLGIIGTALGTTEYSPYKMILIYINGRNLAINERIGNETQILTNQIWKGRVEDLQEKVNTLLELMER